MHNRVKVIRCVAILMIVIVATGLLVKGLYDIQLSRAEHISFADYLSEQETMRDSNSGVSIAKFKEFAEDRYTSNADKAVAYDKIAIIYNNLGDTAEFLEAITKAEYFAKKADSNELLAEIYSQRASFLITKDNTSGAQKYLDIIYDLCDIVGLQDNRLAVYITRLQALNYLKAANVGSAANEIALSDKLLEGHEDSKYYDEYSAINSLIKAQIMFENDEFTESRECVDDLINDGVVIDSVHHDTIIKEYTVPLLALNAKLSINEDCNISQIARKVDYFVSYCNNADTYIIATQTLSYIKKNITANKTSLEGAEAFLTDIDEYLDTYYEAFTQEYNYEAADMADSISAESLSQVELVDQQEASVLVRNLVAILAVLIVAVSILVTNHVAFRGLKDPLTGAYSRTAFERIRVRLLQKTIPYSVIFMDIDDFKKINDKYGHQVGDEVLEIVGRIFSYESDALLTYRYGGEEFVIVALKKSLKHTIVIADRIREEIASYDWQFGGSVTVSVGVAESRNNKQVLSIADDNLYFAKNNGKNSIVYREGNNLIMMRGGRILQQEVVCMEENADASLA